MGRIDVVVSNADYGLFGAAEEATDAQIDRQIATNLTGSIALIRAALPHLRRQGGGRIVQVSSQTIRRFGSCSAARPIRISAQPSRNGSRRLKRSAMSRSRPTGRRIDMGVGWDGACIAEGARNEDGGLDTKRRQLACVADRERVQPQASARDLSP
jgi:NAD(P)-dependent dehydrogenase (short-subunit alcohol dehydrogenase family)